MAEPKILAINPGSTSTKIGLFEGKKCILKKTIRHEDKELNRFEKITDQFQFRKRTIIEVLNEANFDLNTLSAVVGRGGLLKPIKGGTYRVNEKMLKDLREGVQGEHASNLGGIIAHSIAQDYDIPAYIVDPVAVDEFEPVARISGLKELERRSLSHALNIKAVGHKVGAELGGCYSDYNFVIVHLGGGISVTAHRKGRMIDVNNANSEGPMSPERTGTLPVSELVALCYSGKYTYEEMKRKITREGGIYSYLGTKNIVEVEKRARSGDERAQLILNAMIYQIGKEIGAMATVLEGKVDRIILTGGIANSTYITNEIIKRVEFIAPVIVVPGEEELEALALGALRVITGQEEEKTYV